jgi:uncharacterized protein (TIGR00266 family)
MTDGSTDALTRGLQFSITHRPDFAWLTIELGQGQQVFGEPSAMATMDPTIELKAGLLGGFGRSLGRAFGGESLIINTFTAVRGPGAINFAPGPAGDMAHYRLSGGRLFLQRGAFVAHGAGVSVSASWQGAKGFFSGEGLVLLQAHGEGDLFFNSYGAIVEIDVSDELIVDTGYVVAFEETLQYRVGVLPGLRAGSQLKSFLFGGEGLVCRFTGRGKVWIQTRTIQPFLRFIHPFRPARSSG